MNFTSLYLCSFTLHLVARAVHFAGNDGKNDDAFWACLDGPLGRGTQLEVGGHRASYLFLTVLLLKMFRLLRI